MTITFEPVTRNELQLLANISRNTFYDTFKEANTEENMNLFLNDTFNLRAIEDEKANPDNHFFFAKIENEVVGYMKLSDRQSLAEPQKLNALEIARIYTIKEKIGSGVGKAMMEFCIEYAQKMKKQVIWLGVWEHNQRAVNFYTRFGFEKFGEHIFMLGTDAQTDWLMKKDLTLAVV